MEDDNQMEEKTVLSVESVIDLTKYCLQNSYFEIEQRWYRVDCGMIGLDLMGVIADIYMENHEMEAVRNCDNPPLAQVRYVDDYLSRMSSEGMAEDYLTYLNSMEEEIQFTMEKEESNKIAVLDLEIEKDEVNSCLRFDVYYKPTCTNIQGLPRQLQRMKST